MNAQRDSRIAIIIICRVIAIYSGQRKSILEVYCAKLVRTGINNTIIIGMPAIQYRTPITWTPSLVPRLLFYRKGEQQVVRYKNENSAWERGYWTPWFQWQVELNYYAG